MRKGILELCILSTIDKKPKYSSEILTRLKESKLLVVRYLYPLLTRLKNAQLLEYRWEESNAGPPRKYFTITKEGKAFLKELNTSWSELSNAVNTLTKNKIMNKTTNIHLAQTLFSLDENADTLLKNYLDKLERLFKNTEGANDILEDIEARIAELFTGLKKDELYVISVEDVEQVIKTLGTPEDLAGEEEINETSSNYNGPKKLFRDIDDRFLGGVAGGLSHYVGLDSVWIRLIMLILFFSSVGGVVLIYVLLWVLIPEAKTTADKLMMKGEPVNISTIKKKIKEEIDQVGDKVKDVDYENLGNQIKKKSKDFSDLVLKLAKGVVKLLTLLIGVFLLFMSSVVLLVIFVSTLIGSVFSAIVPQEIMQFGLTLDIPVFILGFCSFDCWDSIYFFIHAGITIIKSK